MKKVNEVQAPNANEQKVLKVVTIDINAKEWFDKANGNSYFSGEVTVNYGMPDELSKSMPFQYGYGNSYEDTAMRMLKDLGLIISVYHMDLKKAGIIVRSHKQTNCKKRDL